MVWFDPAMNWHAEPSGRRGGQTVYSDAAIQACLTIKGLFGLPLRQTTGFVASPARGWQGSTGRCRTTRRCAAGRRP